MTTVFGLKIENFILENKNKTIQSKSSKFIQSIEYHCVLKNLSPDLRYIRLSHILPHPKSSTINKCKFLFLYQNDDIVYKQVMKLIEMHSNDIITRNVYKYRLLIQGYLRSLKNLSITQILSKFMLL